MVAPKCRLEVWKPKIRLVNADGTLAGLYEPDRWVACDTHENIATNQRRGNALESVNLSDSIFSSMYATMRVTNRPQDFKSYDADVYKHVYKDSDGKPIPNYPSYPNTLSGGEVYLRQRWGVFTNFFYEFQHVRIVDLETHLVLFAGRLTKITKRYEDGNGSIIQLEALDALNDIANITTAALVKSATFSNSYRRSDLVKYLLNLATDYEGNQPSTGPGVDVQIANSDVTTIANSTGGILTNEDIGTSTATNQYSRFEQSAVAFRGDIKWNANMTGTKHLLAEISRWSMLDPHASNTSERAFGYDFFVDANYGKHNLAADKGPGITGFNLPHFNYFKRGNRLSAAGGAGQDAAVYGLTVKYPTLTTAARVGATAINVGDISESINDSVTTFEVTNNGIVPGIQIQIDDEYMYVKQVMPDVTGGGAGDELEVLRAFASTDAASHSVNAVIKNPRSAQTVMQRGFNFEDNKEDLYTEAVLTYNTAKDNKLASGVHESTAPHFAQKRFEIMYVTEVALGGGSLFHWDGRNITAANQTAAAISNTAEEIDVYNAAGAKQADAVARIQYQSHSVLTGSTNFAYILLSDIGSVPGGDAFPTANYSSDTYVELRGATSGAKCRLNLAAGLTEAHEGRPSKVWGTHKVLDMGLMSDEDPTDLRTEIAARLAQSTTGLRQGAYSFSKAPYYWWDGLVHSVGTAANDSTLGQDITVKNINGSAAVNITNFGVREGMLVHKMTANHAGIERNPDTNNPAIQLDTYGYIGRMTNSTQFAVNLGIRDSLGGSPTSGRTFAVGDPIRIIIPVRAGTEVFVDNVIAEVYGEHIISKVAYNEDPIPETRVSSVGKNESRLGGGHRVKGLISQIAQTALGVRERSQTLQPQALGSLFGSLVVTIPNGSEAPTALKATWSAGSVNLVDGRVFNFAAGSTAVSTYGLGANMVANQHYIVYLDPEGENVGPEGTHHLYTKRVGTYTRDTDNIPIFHIIATNTAGITKPTIRLQPNVWLNNTEVNGTLPLTNEASNIIDIATITEALMGDLAIDTRALVDNAVSAIKIPSTTIIERHFDNSGGGCVTSASITTGTITGKTFVDTGLEIDNSGYVRSADKTDYGDTTAGFWLGKHSGAYKLDIGSATNYMKWDGSDLTISGTLTASTFLTSAGAVRAANGAHELSTGFTSPTTGILIDQYGILGATGTGATNVEFYMSAADGKAYFGAAACTIGKDGIVFSSAADTVAHSLRWDFGGSSTHLYRFTNSNIIRWTSNAGADAGRMDLVTMDLNLVGGNLFVAIGGTKTSLAPLYSGGATTLHSHSGSSGVALGDTPIWTGRHKWTFSSTSQSAIWSSASPGQFDYGMWLKDESVPSAPDSGYIRLYSESGVLKYKNSSNTIVSVGGVTESSSPTWSGNHNFNGNVYINSGTIHIGNAAADIISLKGVITGGGYAAPGFRWNDGGVGVAGMYFEDDGTYSRTRFVGRGQTANHAYISSDGTSSYIAASAVTGNYTYASTAFRAASNGAAATPPYSFSNSTNSGMYLYSTSSPAIASAGSTKIIFNTGVSAACHIYEDLNVHGSLTKTSGTFSIAHPLDEDNKTLVHGFVESPRYDLIYRGSAILSGGTATVSIDEASNNMTVGTFEALTKNPQVWVQNDTGWGAVKGTVENGNMVITAEDNTSSDTISWLVVAERNDTFIRSKEEPWTDETGAFVPEWDTASFGYPVV